jgi:hypothetical protein
VPGSFGFLQESSGIALPIDQDLCNVLLNRREYFPEFLLVTLILSPFFQVHEQLDDPTLPVLSGEGSDFIDSLCKVKLEIQYICHCAPPLSEIVIK